VDGTARISEVAPGIRRVTLPQPLGVDHVHCYLLRGETGWTLVDTGVGDPGAGGPHAPGHAPRGVGVPGWRAVLARRHWRALVPRGLKPLLVG